MGAIIVLIMLLWGGMYFLISHQSAMQKDIAIECIKAGKEFKAAGAIAYTCEDKKN